MFKLFKNNFKTTNDCIILATPLIIFLSIISWYFSLAKESVDSIPKLILAIITLMFLICGSCSIWFYMAKKIIKLSNTIFVFEKDRIQALKNIFKSLIKGIEKLFLPFLGMITISAFVYTGVILLVTVLVSKYIGTVDTGILSSINVLLSSGELIKEVNSIPINQIMVITCWYLSMCLITLILSFFTILWIPEIVYLERNPIKALYYSVQKVFNKFPQTLLLFVYINILNIGISVLNTLLMFHPVTYFLVLLLYYYFLVYIVVLLFSYYEQFFVKKQQKED